MNAEPTAAESAMLELTFEAAPIGKALVAPDGQLVRVNPALCRLLSRSESELLAGTLQAVISAGDLDPDLALFDELLKGGRDGHQLEKRLVRGDGELLWAQLDLAASRDADGKVACLVVQVQDITERRLAQQKLQEQEAVLRLVLDTVGVGVGIALPDGTMLRNPAHRKLLGLTDEQATGALSAVAREIAVFDEHGHQLQPHDYPLARALDGDEPGEVPLRIGPRGGPQSFVLSRTAPMRDDHGQVVGAVTTLADVTPLRAAQAQAEQANAFYQALLAATPDAIFITDITTGLPTYCSDAIESVLGITPARLQELGPAVRQLVHPDDLHRLDAATRAALAVPDGQAVAVRYRCRHADGGWRWVSRHITPFSRDSAGDVTHVLGVLRDVTELVAAEDRLTHIALHDSLTGLPNRMLLLDRLATALARVASTGRAPAVIYVDLDGFKQVNDLAGHAAGDAVLIEAARRLRAAVRDVDTVARIGGDEFVVLVEPYDRRATDNEASATRDAGDEHTAHDVADRITQTLAEPFQVDGQRHAVTASVGLARATASPSSDAQQDAERLLRDADTAMYEAKRRGKNRYATYPTDAAPS